MLSLTKFRAEDAPLYASLVFNDTVMTMNMGRVFTKEEADFFFDTIIGMNNTDGIVGYYKVMHEGVFIGMFGISEHDDDSIEIEYMLLPEYWGKGYATQLIRTQINRIMDRCPGKKILAITDPHNIGSIKVLERNGFAKVMDFVNEDGEDASLYALRSECL